MLQRSALRLLKLRSNGSAQWIRFFSAEPSTAAVSADHLDAKHFPTSTAFDGEEPKNGFLGEGTEDLTTSFTGIAAGSFPKEAVAILNADINPDDVEVKPDGLLYLPEIKYRRILNRAFGPGGWGLVPRTFCFI